MNSSENTAICVRDLVKVYHGRSRNAVTALDGLSLEVNKGEIFGLLGRNGAGKTTLLRILTTLVQPTGGSAEVYGLDVVAEAFKVRQHICAVLQENAVDVYLSVISNLTTFARFHSIPKREILARAEAVMGQFGLEEYRNQSVIDLSGGLKRRVQVAKVFMIDKPVVFLDEATTGMDPVNKRATLEAIHQQAREGRTIFLVTQILQEAEELCDRIAIIDRGRCIATGDVPKIKAMAAKIYDLSVTFTQMRPEILQAAGAFPLLKLQAAQTTLEMSVNASETTPFALLDALSRVEPIVHFEVTSASLEDVFLELLGSGDSGKSRGVPP
jgi:ABC-2 type transport system ATP-binding protein